MSWRFVGRTEQIDRIRAALDDKASGPIMIIGESGAGRSAVLSRVLEKVDRERNSVLRVEPMGDAPFAAIGPYLPQAFAHQAGHGDAIPDAVAALAEHAGARRLVIAMDDAHLADHASLLTLRTLSRQHGAVLLITRPVPAEPDRQDPTDSLSYERHIQIVHLPPLSLDEVAAVLNGLVGGHVHPVTTGALHAATRGNPRRLYELVVTERLSDRMVMGDGVWRLAEAPRAASPCGDAKDLVDAARRAWRELAMDRVDELCRLAMWRGAGPQVADIWGNVLLLRGRAGDAIGFLDSLPSDMVEETAELVLVKAMTLALGLGQSAAIDDLLARATSVNPRLRERLIAYRAWILAVTGQTDKAAEALQGVNRSDRETAVFMHATRAVAASARDRVNEAVFHFRRALATVESCPSAPPWMPPYLTACLIDAMLLAGRISEATSIASCFHGGEPGSGWEIAVALSALLTGRETEQRATTRQSPMTPMNRRS